MWAVWKSPTEQIRVSFAADRQGKRRSNHPQKPSALPDTNETACDIMQLTKELRAWKPKLTRQNWLSLSFFVFLAIYGFRCFDFVSCISGIANGFGSVPGTSNYLYIGKARWIDFKWLIKGFRVNSDFISALKVDTARPSNKAGCRLLDYTVYVADDP
jgi:hypothetical protein